MPTTDVSWLDLGTLGIALAGLALSGKSAWQEHRRDQVRLDVRPKIAHLFGPDDPRARFAFEIANVGAFAITVKEVGFLLHGTTDRAAIVLPYRNDNGPWPRRLEPHESMTVFSSVIETMKLDLARIRCVYAATATGVVAEGDSPSLQRVIRQGSAPPPPQDIRSSSARGAYFVSDYEGLE
jgi:hypothetical protein